MNLNLENLQIREIRIELLQLAVSELIKESNFRCYQRPVKVNGYPFGYAKTFKIISVKRRKRK
jgi:hypothetical protein